jgi:hypothetical protein
MWVLGIALVLMLIYLALGIFFASNADGVVEARDKANNIIGNSIIGIILIIIAYILARLAMYVIANQRLPF